MKRKLSAILFWKPVVGELKITPNLFALLIALMFGIAQIATAAPLGDGIAAHKRGEYVEAVKWFRLAAAQYNLGLMYDNGHDKDV